jgi:hypothetical protein
VIALRFDAALPAFAADARFPLTVRSPSISLARGTNHGFEFAQPMLEDPVPQARYAQALGGSIATERLG